MSKTYSFHNFMFPFQWQISGYDDKPFSEQIRLQNIEYGSLNNWTRAVVPTKENELDDLYNEKNYFYEFVHDALYDNGKDDSLIRHFERTEPQRGDVTYKIQCKGKNYELRCDAINLNLYSTGVGVLSFFLYNDKYAEPEDVLRINQYGRRVFPPSVADAKFHFLTANRIEFDGLHGSTNGYSEDFSRYNNRTPDNTPAKFIIKMINEVAQNISIQPIIDDRMFVQCWYYNDEWANQLNDAHYEKFLHSNEWYKLVFVDNLKEITCQNEKMQKRLIENATYERWQKYSSLYGVSRYSEVYLTSSYNIKEYPYLTKTFETMYARLTELILVQKASVLRFSREVTIISRLEGNKGISDKVSSLYKEYIRFVNQIHFREVSAQDQGIELYSKLYNTLNLKEHVEKLDDEIEELFNYVSLSEDHKTNNTMSQLTWIATIAVPMTVVAAIFGMNNVMLNGKNEGQNIEWYNHFWPQIGLIVGITIISYLLFQFLTNKSNKRKK